MNVLVRFASMILRKPSTVISSGGLGGTPLLAPPPALLTRMSTLPCRFTVSATTALHSASTVTSMTKALTADLSWRDPPAVSHLALLRPAITTTAPHSSRPRAMPLPMPPLPPVTMPMFVTTPNVLTVSIRV